ncbi:MAG: TetR/AcrR family transcriptional regulator [Prolixibacteraceae bacterium]|nr:TetR/AcrR family transcriptional regulator [Prolixibacteraceae bacterium]MBN2649680.1 TetR/AcrR family transcriptional regulator [Prolixibacteraceae bacterium]
MNALKVETEKKIIEAAKEVFVEKGLQGARMQEIADRAGINKALLHYYFRSKDKLFDAIFENIMSQMFAVVAENIRTDMSLPELLGAFVEFYNDFFQMNPFYPQFIFHEIWQNPDRLSEIMKSQQIAPAEIVEKIQQKVPAINNSDLTAEHMIANVLGMTLFPHIARPLFQRVFFNNDNDKYSRFLSERTDFLKELMTGALMGATSSEMNNKPDEDF